jgi:hypothetical protein
MNGTHVDIRSVTDRVKETLWLRILRNHTDAPTVFQQMDLIYHWLSADAYGFCYGIE